MYLHVVSTNTKNRSDKIHSICLADFISSYVSKKVGDVPVGPYEIKSYTVPVSNIDDDKLNPNIIVLRTDLVKCRNIVDLSLFVFEMKNPEEHYLRPLQL